MLGIPLLVLFCLGMMVYGTLYFGLNYFGGKILRDFLQKRILLASDSLYTVDFENLHINVANGDIRIYGFRMIPDTLRYQKLQLEKRATRALYDLSYESLFIERLRIIHLLKYRQVKMREMIINQPEITMVAYPDSMAARKGKFNIIYRDIYPLASQVFQDFHIDSIRINQGYMLTERRQSSGKLNEGEYEFSAVLRNFSVNPFSFYNPDRVFYSTGIDLTIYNYSFALADSLYFLKASEIGFSLSGSFLHGKNIELKPNFSKAVSSNIPAANLIQLNLPAFRIEGLNLYEVLTRQQVDLQELVLDNLKIKVFRIRKPGASEHKAVEGKGKIKLADLYEVIRGKLRSIAVDNIRITGGSFDFYSSLNARRPEISVLRTWVTMSECLLDSNAHLDREQILYSRDFELQMQGLTMLLRDSLHMLTAGELGISTRERYIYLENAVLFPGQRSVKNPADISNQLTCRIPGIYFDDLDMEQLYHDRVFDYGHLTVDEPDMRISRSGKVQKEEVRFRKPSDFFAEENEDYVFLLFKKYLNAIYGDSTHITNGYIRIFQEHGGRETSIASGMFDLKLFDFEIDSTSRMNTKGYFYSQDFAFHLQQLALKRPDSLTHLQIQHLDFNTRDSLIHIQGLRFGRIPDMERMIHRPAGAAATSLAFRADDIRLVGLNHRRLFLEKILTASTLHVSRPVLQISSEHFSAPEQEDILPLSVAAPERFFYAIALRDLRVVDGEIDYDNTGGRREQSFNLKKVEFRVLNPFFEIPVAGVNPGKFSFDSLELSVKPLRAAIADSLYEIEIGSFSMHSYPVWVNLENIRIIPAATIDQSGRPLPVRDISIPDLDICGFYFDRALFNREWIIDSLIFRNPSVTMSIEKRTPQESISGQSGVLLPPFMKRLVLQKSRLINSTVSISRPGQEPFSHITLHGNACISGIEIDSLTRLRERETIFSLPGDITLESSGLSWIPADSLYRLSFSGIRLSTAASSLEIDSFRILPRYSREEFSALHTYQKDMVTITLPRLSFSGLSFSSLIRDKSLSAKRLMIDSPFIENYRDKRLPMNPDLYPPNPVQRLNGLKFGLDIDSVIARNGYLVYYEQRYEDPGMIFFNDVNLIIQGVSNCPERQNRSPRLDMNVLMNLMGKGPVNVNIRFPSAARTDSFYVSGSIGQFDLQELNPMITNLLPAEVTGGTVNKIHILRFGADSVKARGLLDFHHSALRFRLIHEDEPKWNVVETTIMNLLLNEAIPASNPLETGKFRQGFIYFYRDPHKGFFNYVWKGIQSGLKSSIGLNDKDQRKYARSWKSEHRKSKK